MCSRFENKETGFSIIEKLSKDFKGDYILEDDNELKKENIAPANLVMSVLKDKETFKLKNYFWGIQFDRAKKLQIFFNTVIKFII